MSIQRPVQDAREVFALSSRGVVESLESEGLGLFVEQGQKALGHHQIGLGRNGDSGRLEAGLVGTTRAISSVTVSPSVGT